METNLFSQLHIRLASLEEQIEEFIYFSLTASALKASSTIELLDLPNFILGEVRQVITSSLYLEYNKSRKQNIIKNFSKYANSYSLVMLSASWEEFMLECIIVMEMTKTDNYALKNERMIRQNLQSEGFGSKSGTELLKELDRLYGLGISQSKEFQIISSNYNLRNCIAHRNGVISKWDLDKSKDFMKTIWKKAIVKEKKQTISAWTLAGKGRFETVLVDEKKQWFENQIIVFKDTEICDIGLNFIEIGNFAFKKLVDYGKVNNIR